MMPLIDVSALLTDPDFTDANSITVYKSPGTVGTNGRVTTTPWSLPITGAVYPAKSSVLQRLPDGEYQTGTIMIATTYPLSEGAGGVGADEVMWNGSRYVVALVDDYTKFGMGFVEATCTLKTLNP